LYASPYITKVIKSRKMRWAGYVARMREMRIVYKILVRRPEVKRPLVGPSVYRRIILEWIVKK